MRVATILLLALSSAYPLRLTPSICPRVDEFHFPSPSSPRVEPKFSPLNPLLPLSSLPVLVFPSSSVASVPIPLSTGQFDPNNFKPVCSASDGLYRALQGATQGIIGPDNYVEYGPLIAGGLLRVRLELCVVESFFNEAVLPFVKQNGLTWVLPLHETVETFVAGSIFALATTFILVGSTKIVTVLVTYSDLLVGAPCRLFGGFFFDRAQDKPVTLDVGVGFFKTRVLGPPVPASEEKLWRKGIELDPPSVWDVDWDNISPSKYPVIFTSGSVKAFGESSKFVRKLTEAVDLFVGRYLVLIASGYLGIKFLHFKVFPDFPFS